MRCTGSPRIRIIRTTITSVSATAPFPDIAAMNALLLAECRAKVQPDDDLWILADLIAGRPTDMWRREVRTIFHALPGRRHLIRGNNDQRWV